MTDPDPEAKMGEKLTEAQLAMLAFYDGRGLTAQSGATGTLSTWRALIRRGLLRRSSGLGVIEAEITEAGRQALLKDQPHD